MKHKTLGFTLLELMIVVAIISILAAFAFPAYREQADKARRADGKALLNNVAQKLERCFTKYGSYNNVNCPTVGDTIQSEDQFYSVTVDTTGIATYTLTAIPQGVQALDAKCASFILDQTGLQTYTGTGIQQDCW